jgi:predicted secreted protein
MSRLDSWRGLAKWFSYCGGQASRIISGKNLLIAVSFFLLIFLGGVTLTSAAQVTVLQENDNGKTINVQVGAIIAVMLGEEAGTGYTWKFNQLDVNYFDLRSTTITPVGAPIGGPLLVTWVLTTKKAGASQLALDLFPPGSGRPAVKHFLVKVKIQ